MNFPIHQNIRKFRIKMNLTQEQLGNSVGVSSQAVSKWECGDNIPDTTLIVSIANTLNVSTDRLLGNEKFCEEDVHLSVINLINQSPYEKKFKKAFDIAWAIECGLTSDDKDNLYLNDALSEITENNGFTLMSLYYDLPFFVIFPEAEYGFSSSLKPESYYLEFFEDFSDNDVINSFFYLYSTPKDYLFEKEVLAEKCSINNDKINYVIEKLEKYCITSEIININNENKTMYSYTFYRQEFIILFAILKTLLEYRKDNRYILQYRCRNTPYFLQKGDSHD